MDTNRTDALRDDLDRDGVRDDRLREDRPADGTAAAADEKLGRADLTDGDITLHSERLVPGVERQEWARVKVTRRIVTEERTITVPVRREELVVEYLGDEPAPQAHQDTVRGSTQATDSRVVEEYVLHEEVPRVELDVVAKERVQVLVDSQQSLVQLSDTIRREELAVDETGHEVSGEARRALDDGRRI